MKNTTPTPVNNPTNTTDNTTPMKMKLLSNSHHRNGVCGTPFDVALIKDEDGSTKVCIDFGGSDFAVLQVDRLAEGDIAFGSNSWRGDRYADKVRELTKNAEPSVAKGALFVNWGTK